MKKYIAVLIVLIIGLFASKASAYTPPAKPDNGWYIVDQAGKLSADQLSQLNSKLEGISKSSLNEFGALIVPSLNGESIEDVAQATFRSWGIGKKDLNNGVLVVIAVSDRKSRIHTGKGIEGDLPDLLCNDILKKNLNPHLKTGDFYGGLNDTFNVLLSTVESRSGKAAVKTPTQSSGGSGMTIFVVLFCVLFLSGALVWYLIYDNKKREREEQERQDSYNRSVRKMREREVYDWKEQLRKAEEAKVKSNYEQELIRQKRVEAARIASDKASKEEAEYHRSIREMHKGTHEIVEVTKKKSHVIKPIVSVGRVKDTSWAEKPSTIMPAASNASTYRRDNDEKDRAAKLAKQAEEESRRSASRRQQEEDDNRRRRERNEEDRRRRDREDDDRRRSSYSSSSSSSWSSYDSGSSSGGGFGGGDSGGGGSSSDW